MPKNGEDWGKLIVALGFKKFPKVQNIAQSGHTGAHLPLFFRPFYTSFPFPSLAFKSSVTRRQDYLLKFGHSEK